MTLSYSRITCFQSCPHKYKLKYKDGNKFPESIYLKSGKRMHKIIAERIEECIKMGMQVVSFTDIDDTDKDAVDVLRDFTLNLPLEIDQYGIEEEFGLTKDWEICNFDDKDAYFRGIIDFYALEKDGTLEIIDHKTGFKVLSREKFENDLQLKLYALYLLIKHDNAGQIYLTRYYPRVNVYNNMLLTRKDIMSFKEEFDNIAKEIESEKDYKAVVSPLCVNCDARFICKPYAKYRKNMPVTIEEMADRISMYKSTIKDYENAIKDYLIDNESIETPTHIIKSEVQTKYDYNAKDVVDYLKESGVDNTLILKYALSVNNTTLKKLYKKTNTEYLDDGMPCKMKHYDKLNWRLK